MKKKLVEFLFGCAIVCTLALCAPASAQTVSASVTGLVFDPNAAVIVEATVVAKNVDTGIETRVQTNEDGIYYFADLGPGNYEFSVSKRGFKVIVKPSVTLHVADTVSMNFTMQVGAINETVTVEGGAPLINTESAAVSTVVDRQFAENLPLNGRSFQALIQMTPGVVVAPVSAFDGGQFNVNGQRASSNYWMVDGVGANIGVSATSFPGNGSAGALGSFNVLGGTSSLVSVDALQEFRIQTSSYAPEFGRTPGGQISIVTRSGTNLFHGTLFDYFRNDILDANNWFADSKGLPKPEERQNDFGGVFGGPIVKDKTFFFFSYEGLRLRLPQTTLTTVPDASARQNAVSAMQPFLNAYSLPNGADNTATGVAQFNASYSNPATLDAYSLRTDYRVNGKVTLFGRYNYSPSEFTQRGASSNSLSGLLTARSVVQTATAGGTWVISPVITNDLRFNYSRTNASSSNQLDSFGGAVPLASAPFPSPYTSQNAGFGLFIFSLQHSGLVVGPQSQNLQRQINLVDNLSTQKGSHSVKVGVDYRRLSPQFTPRLYNQNPDFSTVPAAMAGNVAFTFLTSQVSSNLLFHNLGLFGQDTWRIAPRLTVTYGLRWDVDFAPSSANGPSLPAVTGFDLNNLANLALAPSGTPPFNTTYGDVAPRLGLAYQLSQSQDWQTVFRGGFGVFYDLATSEVGNLYSTNYPFGAQKTIVGGAFPLSQAAAAPPPVTVAQLQRGTLAAVDPNLALPYTLQWNVSTEQALGREQSLSVTYLGAVGRRLIQSASIASPNSNFGFADLVTNRASSDYHAMELQFQRRLSHGLQALASYNWAHSIDTASAGSFGKGANAVVPALGSAVNRGPSDFDIRHAFSAGVTYDMALPRINALANAIFRGWSVETLIQARSAPPVDVSDLKFSTLNGALADVRPDIVSGQPFYLFGPQYPGGKALNPAAFHDPPNSGGTPLRQGNVPRNFLRGFGATQWDFAVHRDFPLREALKLEFRAEMFNLLNHPNFGPPSGQFGFGGFGVSRQTLAQALSGGGVSGGFNPLYQIGGPRSIQLGLKFMF